MRHVVAMSLLCVATACGNSEVTGDVPDAGTSEDLDFFIARQIDFKNFRQWPKYKVHEEVDDGSQDLDAGVDVDGGDSHPPGDRYAYVNKLPPSGSTLFPTGTIIVKTAVAADGKEDPHIHAMVKRNGGFNSKGAVGWEWMELLSSDEGTPIILWRDSSPPDGSGYTDPGNLGAIGDCNACHTAARENDFVQSIPLRLKNF